MHLKSGNYMADDNVIGLNLEPISTEEITEASKIIYEQTLAKGYVPTVTPYRRLGDNKDVIELCLVVGELLEKLKRTVYNIPGEGEKAIIPADWNLFYAPAYPPQLAKGTGGQQTQDSPHEKASNIITWKVVKRMAASIDEQPFTGRRPHKPRLRGANPSNVSGQYIEEYSQWMDNLVQFDCFAKSNLEAECLIQNFEDTLEFYRDLFVAAGAQRWLYWDRVTDQEAVSRATDNTMYVRSFNYYVRTERFILTGVQAITEIINEVLIKIGKSQ